MTDQTEIWTRAHRIAGQVLYQMSYRYMYLPLCSVEKSYYHISTLSSDPHPERPSSLGRK